MGAEGATAYAPGVDAGVAEPGLRAGTLSLPGLLVQGVAAVAPALSLLISFQFTTSFAGVAAPLAYLLSFALVLMLGIVLTQLAKAMPSAGGYYTYVSGTLHPRVGFLVAWQYFLFIPLAPALNLAFAGFLIERTIRSEYGVRLPWWSFMLGGLALTAVLVYRGIEISIAAAALFALAEIVVVVVLAAWGVVQPGAGGVNLHSYHPGNAPSAQGLYLAIVFGVFAFAGWEALAPLAEETRRPRRNVPLAIVVTILLLGVFMVFSAWGLMVGWGTERTDSLARSQVFAPFALAEQFWGGAWLIVLAALLNSVLAVSVACTTASTRMWYAMARSGSLPSVLTRLHPRHRTPVAALALQTAIVLVVGLGLGFWLGPRDEFFTLGLVTLLALTFVYAGGNAGVLRHYLGARRAELNPLVHVVLPVLTTSALVWAAYKTFDPLPPSPYRYALVVAPGWLLVGGLLLWTMRRRGREEWLLEAAQTAEA